MAQTSAIRQRLAVSGALFGLVQAFPNPQLAEMAGLCGYDFMLLDGEHGMFDEADYLNTLRTLTSVNVLAMIRLAVQDPHAIGRYLDIGADVIVVPNISSAEEAQRMARAMEYPPNGTRGFGASLHRATKYGAGVPEHLRAPRASAALLAIIESARGVTNIESILAVDGVDGVLVGPMDLSIDLGVSADFAQRIYAQSISRVEEMAAARGKLLGTAPHAGYPVEELLARGHRLLILGTDVSLIREAMSSQVSNARSQVTRHFGPL